MKTWKELGYKSFKTQDGSLTLASVQQGSELMHHSGGALEETYFIYGRPLQRLFEDIPAPSIFSLGLGLGYIEMVTAAIGMRSRKPFQLLTMEIDQNLVNVMLNFLEESLPAGEIQQDLNSVLEAVAQKFELDPGELKLSLKNASNEKAWQIHGEFSEASTPAAKFHGIMYDAFSSKTSPQLWTEEFLTNFLGACAEQNALLTTYAFTGNLKRALKNEHFEMIDRTGFQGKRQSTLGIRGPLIARQGF